MGFSLTKTTYFGVPPFMEPPDPRGLRVAPVVEVLIPVGEVLIKLSQLVEGSAV